ncbi:hypothetical protein CA54_31820 [Symmachiella macrocystis]|uniref:Uncharacterized protein n=1 Tax=Symmachiella macrocystis TaxID=2527985 RepID=A0A5C6BRF3_9PLAN|nr:hypothetical protein [Symmachiella macrocystis]TWU14337.1 hypothetical protein CA54_31820 [Symmachiella macrocystis]
MGIYVIAKKNVADLQTAVFYADEDGQEEAVAVFTSDDRARVYISDSDWDQTETVAELTPIDFLQWLTSIRGKGTQFLAVNPVRDDQDQGIAQPVLNIEEQLLELAAVLEGKLEAPAPPPRMETQEVEIFHCEKRGEFLRQPAGRTAPACCDQEMQQPAVDKVTIPYRGRVSSA